ncbi:27766_t:CDS:2, partial [Gigaspora margarita]
ANGYMLSPKRRNVKPSIRKRSNNTNNVNIESAADQSDADETNNAHGSLGDNDHSVGQRKVTKAKANGYTLLSKKKNVDPSIRRQNSNINNAVNIESAIDQHNTGKTNNTRDSLGNNTTQAKANGYILQPKKKNVKPPIKSHSTNNVVNIESTLNQGITDETNNSLGDNVAYSQDNTDEIPHDSNTLTPALDAFSYTDLENITSQCDTLTLARNRLERKTQSPMCLHNTNIEDNNQDTTNIDADQGNKIPTNNVSLSLKSILRSSVQK